MGTSLDYAISHYLDDLQAAGRSPCTVTCARSALHLFREYAGDVSIDKASNQAIPYLAWRSERIRRNTLSAQYSHMRQMFVFAARRGWLRRNPLEDIPKPLPERVVTRPLKDGDLERLFAAGDEYERAALLLLLGSGMRIGELSGLKWTDISADEIVVRGNGAKERTVAPGRVALAALLLLPRVDGRVFPYHPVYFQDKLHRLAQRTGVPFHPHKMRHTFARRFIDAGGSVEELSELLGHASLETTAIYLKAFRREGALAAQRRFNPADALFGGDDDDGGKVSPVH